MLAVLARWPRWLTAHVALANKADLMGAHTDTGTPAYEYQTKLPRNERTAKMNRKRKKEKTTATNGTRCSNTHIICPVKMVLGVHWRGLATIAASRSTVFYFLLATAKECASWRQQHQEKNRKKNNNEKERKTTTTNTRHLLFHGET